ncbi:MAG: ORF6N domain-containing protein [Candidatus Moraniibacteriota bacterium]
MLNKFLNNKIKNKIVIPSEIIENKIFLIRGKKIMFDRDLAVLYGVETRILNQAVRRNKDRFPDDFMFQLTATEFDIWKSQIVISNKEKMGLRKIPLVFTEQGVAMLSSVLKSKRAIQVNIQIMRTFTKIREMIIGNKELRLKIEAMEKKYDDKFNSVFDAIKRILIAQVKEEPERKNKIGFRIKK